MNFRKKGNNKANFGSPQGVSDGSDERISVKSAIRGSRKASLAVAVCFMIFLAPLTTFIVFPPQQSFATFPGYNGRIAFVMGGEIFSMNSDGTNPTRLTNTAAVESSPDWSPDGSEMVFVGDGAPNEDIWVMNADGSGATQLTSNALHELNPTWSPDGSMIAFDSNALGGAPDIFVMNADGTGVQNLTGAVGGARYENPTWSPDGSMIAFSTNSGGTPGTKLAVMNSDGSGLTLLTDGSTHVFNPDWSPDGSKIVFDDNRDIYVINADGTGQVQLTPTGPANSIEPTWSPDGSLIAFESDRDSPQGELYVMNADGTGITRLTNNAAVERSPDFGSVPLATISFDQATYTVNDFPAITITDLQADRDPSSVDSVQVRVTSTSDAVGLFPIVLSETGANTGVFFGNISLSTSVVAGHLYVKNGDDITAEYTFSGPPATDIQANAQIVSLATGTEDIAFATDRDGNYEIYVMNADGTGQVRLTTDAATDSTPSFSSDGTKIAFVSDRDGNNEIYIMNADGSGQTNLSNDPADDFSPSFSSDGSQIVFDSNRDGNMEIYIMNSDGSGVTRLTNNLDMDESPAFSPDGTKIVFESQRDGNPEIYTMNTDGTGVTRLTNNPALDVRPRFSENGAYIVFDSDRDGNTEVYIMKADGSGQTNLTNNPALDELSGFSSDGTQIVFASTRDGNYEIYIMNADGSGATRLTNNAAVDTWPAFRLPTAIPDSTSPTLSAISDSPDPFSPPGSTTISFTSDEAGVYTVMIMTMANSPVQNLTGAMVVGINSPVWDGMRYDATLAADDTYKYIIEARDAAGNFRPLPAQDGTITLDTTGGASTTPKIVFDTDRDGNTEIYIMNADGSGQTRLTNNVANDFNPVLSPDGTKIAFVSDRDGNREIYIMDIDGTGQTNLTNNAATDDEPSFSGTGKITFTSNRDGNNEIYIMNSDGSGQTNITNNPGDDESPSFSGDGSKIVFMRFTGSQEIYIMNSDGTGVTRLTNSAGIDTWPAFSHDGTKIAFVTTRDGNFQIYTMNPDGSGQTNISNNALGDFYPSFSPDDTQIAFMSSRDGNNEIYIMNADGTGQTRITNNAAFDANPDFGAIASSPLVPKIVFQSDRDGNNEIYIMNADGSGQIRLTNNPADDYVPSLSSDTGVNKIAFSSNRDGNYEIYIMNVDGTSQTRLTNNAAFDSNPGISPDGTKIAFSSNRDGPTQIYIMNPDGTGQTRLTNNAAFDDFPTFSPDGTKIVFTSTRDGNDELYIMNVDGTSQTRLTNNAATDFSPHFSPDGTKIAFSSNRDGNYEIYIMNVDGTGQINLTNNAAFDSHPSFSPDGTKITFVTSRDGNFEVYIMNVDGTGQTNLSNSNSSADTEPNFGLATSTGSTQITIGSVSTTTPFWDADPVTVSGSTSGSVSGDSVSIDWGDGTAPTTGIAVDISGAWGPTSHIYSSSALATNPNNIVATLLDSTSAVKATSVATPINVQKHETVILLNSIPSIVHGTAFTVSGKLIDNVTKMELTGRQITFTGSGVAAIGGPQLVETAGVTFSHPTNANGVQSVFCASCVPDEGHAPGSGNLVLHLAVGSEIILPKNTYQISMSIQNMGVTPFTVLVTKHDDTTFTPAPSGGIAPNVASFDFGSPDAIAKITITSVGGSTTSGYVGLASIKTFDPNGDPSLQHVIDFEELTQGLAYPTGLVEQPGYFYSVGTSENIFASNWQVTAQFAGEADYAQTLTTTSYDTIERTIEETTGTGTAGATITTHAQSGMTAVTCSIDTDRDGICNDWETGGYIRTSDASYPLCIDPVTGLTTIEDASGNQVPICNPDQKDIFVEIDYMLGATPSTSFRPTDNAINRVIQAFASHNIKLHVTVDDSNPIPYAAGGFNVWSESDGNLENDFDNVKLRHFGTTAEQESTPILTDNPLLKAKAQIFHYALFVNSIGACDPAVGGTSGNAEEPGSNFVIALGCGFANDENQQAGTFMHELGHNLGLDHGGPIALYDASTNAYIPVNSNDYTMNCKPNYASIMTYSRQFPTYFAGNPWPLDYSGETLATLDNAAILEKNGLQASARVPVIYGTPTLATPTKVGFTYTGTTPTGIDWNGDGTTDTGNKLRMLALNNLGITGCKPSQDAMLQDPGFEKGGAGWTLNGATINSSTRVISGAGTKDLIRPGQDPISPTLGAYSPLIPVKPNTMYNVEADTTVTGNVLSQGQSSIELVYYDSSQLPVAGNSPVSGSASVGVVAGSPAPLQHIEAAWKTPATAVYVKIRLINNVVGSTSHFDNLGINELFGDNPGFESATVWWSQSGVTINSDPASRIIAGQKDLIKPGGGSATNSPFIAVKANTVYNLEADTIVLADGAGNGLSKLDVAFYDNNQQAITTLPVGTGLVSSAASVSVRPASGDPIQHLSTAWRTPPNTVYVKIKLINNVAGSTSHFDNVLLYAHTNAVIMNTYNDWNNLQFNFRGATGIIYGIYPDPVKRQEITSIVEEGAAAQVNQFSGLLSPFSQGGAIISHGSTVPVMFELYDAEGNPITDAVASIKVARATVTTTGGARIITLDGPETDPASADGATNLFHYDTTSHRYVFHWQTTASDTGMWAIKVYIDYGTDTQTLLDRSGLGASATVLIAVPPSVTGTPDRAPNSNGWYKSAVTVSWSGIANTPGATIASCDSPIVYSGPDGAAISVVGHCIDSFGVTGTGNYAIKYDSTPPSISSSQQGQNFLVGQPVPASAACTDSLSGIASCISTPATLDTATAGPHSYSVTSTDKAGNSATLVVNYNVNYKFVGLLQPISSDGSSSFKLGSTVPVKFQLVDGNGKYVTNVRATIFVAKINNNALGPEVAATGNGKDGNLFRLDGNQYMFNWETKGLTSGTWAIKVYLNYGTSTQQLVDMTGTGMTQKVTLKS